MIINIVNLPPLMGRQQTDIHVYVTYNVYLCWVVSSTLYSDL